MPDHFPPNPCAVQGRRILIIGGSRGIGRAIAWRLASAGAKVLVNYVRERDAAAALEGEAAAAGLDISTIRADVTSDKGREELLAVVRDAPGPLSGMVFAAATGVHKPHEELTGRHFDFTFALNVKSFLLLVQALSPSMEAGGSIVALSSEGAVHAMPHYTLVGSSKGALESMVRHLAVELGKRGLRVNALSPGTVRTDAWAVLPDAERRLSAAAERSALGRLATTDEVASAAQFLLSDAASAISGHTLVVDCGARVVGAG